MIGTCKYKDANSPP